MAPGPISAGIIGLNTQPPLICFLGAARGAMLKKTFNWIVFFGALLLLVFSASSFVRTLDSLLWPIRFGILAGFSVLFVGYWWRHRNATIQETIM
jgi:hypothetical protein